MRALLAVALLLTGCAPVTDATHATAAIGLDGTAWVLTAIQGNAPVADSNVTLNFEQGSASGSGGCNQYRAEYTTSGSKLELGLTSSTERACLAREKNAQETAYLHALAKVATFRISEERLVLRDTSGATLLEFAKARNQ